MPLWVMTRKPRQTRLAYRAGAVYTFNFPAFCFHMAKAKLYINGGGSLIQDVTSHRSLWFYLFTLAAAKRLGCKVMMYGCGIGPLQSPRNRKQAGKTIDRNVDVITLRDQASQEELASIGVRRPRIVLAADPAVTLPADPPQAAEALLEQAYERYGLLPVFISIESKLDHAAAGQVVSRLQKAPAAILPACKRSELSIALFSRMDIALSMRLHALIFAAARGVPLVGVVYDPKVSAFLDSVDQDLYIPLDQLAAPSLCALLDSAAQRRQDRAALEEKTARLVELERGNSTLAAELLAD